MLHRQCQFRPRTSVGQPAGPHGVVSKRHETAAPVRTQASPREKISKRVFVAQDLTEEQRREDFAALDRMRETVMGVSPEEIEREVARAVVVVREGSGVALTRPRPIPSAHASPATPPTGTHRPSETQIGTADTPPRRPSPPPSDRPRGDRNFNRAPSGARPVWAPPTPASTAPFASPAPSPPSPHAHPNGVRPPPTPHPRQHRLPEPLRPAITPLITPHRPTTSRARGSLHRRRPSRAAVASRLVPSAAITGTAYRRSGPRRHSHRLTV